MVPALTLPWSNGLTFLNEVRRVSPATRGLVLGAKRSEDVNFAALEAGARGNLLKKSSRAEFFMAVRSLLGGANALSPARVRTVVTGYLGVKRLKPVASRPGALSDREKEVLKLIAEGFRTKAMGVLLCISSKTVEQHRANLMSKLDRHSLQARTTHALQRGLVATGPEPTAEGAFPWFP